jgi:hypothetical protein
MSDGELRKRVKGEGPIFDKAADAIIAPRRLVDSHRPAHAEKRSIRACGSAEPASHNGNAERTAKILSFLRGPPIRCILVVRSATMPHG